MNQLLLKLKRQQQIDATEPKPQKKQIYAQLLHNLKVPTTNLSRYPVSGVVVEKLEVENARNRILEEVGVNTIYTDRKRDQMRTRLDELERDAHLQKQRDRLHRKQCESQNLQI